MSSEDESYVTVTVKARGQVMLAAVSPFDASELLLDVDLDDRDRIARIAKELAASADF